MVSIAAIIFTHFIIINVLSSSCSITCLPSHFFLACHKSQTIYNTLTVNNIYVNFFHHAVSESAVNKGKDWDPNLGWKGEGRGEIKLPRMCIRSILNVGSFKMFCSVLADFSAFNFKIPLVHCGAHTFHLEFNVNLKPALLNKFLYFISSWCWKEKCTQLDFKCKWELWIFCYLVWLYMTVKSWELNWNYLPLNCGYSERVCMPYLLVSFMLLEKFIFRNS